jgi:hypothetical protein
LNEWARGYKEELLKELRILCREMTYTEARNLPTEFRKWWIGQMIKDREEEAALLAQQRGSHGDVPR